MPKAPDIFLSYAREDLERARALAEALEGLGWQVFWDRKIPTGSTWHEYIGERLESARCVVVAWTATSVRRQFVIEEARDAHERGVLRPVFFEKVKPPLGLRSVQAADLTAWNGDPEADEFKKFVADLTVQVAGAAEKTRPVGEPDGPRSPGRLSRRIHWLLRGALATVCLILVVLWLDWLSGWTAGREADAAKRLAEARRAAAAPTWDEDAQLNLRIRIDAGKFLMGTLARDGLNADWIRDERPPHWVRVSSFYIQEHEVTNNEYQRFDPSHPRGAEDHPVVNVSWTEARAYAEWLGGDLPTEAQWEFAARGTEGRLYPWGAEEPSCDRANYEDCERNVMPVVSYRNARTPEGLADLAGNAWEWCRDWYGPYRGERQKNPRGPEDGLTRVLRGGSWRVVPFALRGAFRNGVTPEVVADDIGFRVAWSSH